MGVQRPQEPGFLISPLLSHSSDGLHRETVGKIGEHLHGAHPDTIYMLCPSSHCPSDPAFSCLLLVRSLQLHLLALLHTCQWTLASGPLHLRSPLPTVSTWLPHLSFRSLLKYHFLSEVCFDYAILNYNQLPILLQVYFFSTACNCTQQRVHSFASWSPPA